MKNVTRAQYVAALEALDLDPHTTQLVTITGHMISVRRYATQDGVASAPVYGEVPYVDETVTVVDDDAPDA